jgi:hypothetical protein
MSEQFMPLCAQRWGCRQFAAHIQHTAQTTATNVTIRHLETLCHEARCVAKPASYAAKPHPTLSPDSPRARMTCEGPGARPWVQHSPQGSRASVPGSQRRLHHTHHRLRRLPCEQLQQDDACRHKTHSKRSRVLAA